MQLLHIRKFRFPFPLSQLSHQQQQETMASIQTLPISNHHMQLSNKNLYHSKNSATHMLMTEKEI
jgi:hypothetical protein